MAAEGRVARFGPTERLLHWVHAAAFAVMLATGLVLYLPDLARAVSDRPAMKSVHLIAALTWAIALVLIATFGDHGALKRLRRQVERLDADDLRWLRHQDGPQGRLNAGQKLHTTVQAGLSILFALSGLLLWLGERDHAFRLPGTLALHDVSTLSATILAAGHVFLAFSTHGSMDGMTRGSVTEAYAREHHPKWDPEA